MIDKVKFVPVTPAGTPCTWLASPTEKEAWRRLLIDAAHMPYKTKENFIKRGYTVVKLSVPRRRTCAKR